jgi:hypothetical protein
MNGVQVKARGEKITVKKPMPREKIRTIRDAMQTVLLLLRQTVDARAVRQRVLKTLLFSTLLSLFSPCAFGQEQAAAPAFKDGDFWHFRITEDVANLSSTRELDGIYELVYTQGAVKGFQLTGDQKLEIALDDRSGLLLQLLGLAEKRSNLKFPLFVGKKWNYVFRPTEGRMAPSRDVEVRVVGIESVTTRAGNFRAFKIIREVNWRSGGRGPKILSEAKSSTSILFYSPESKSIVKESMESSDGSSREVELIKIGSEDGRR